MSAATEEPLGTAAEEAARLVESLHGWFGSRSGWAGAGSAGSGPAGSAEHGAGADDQAHGPTCRACPLCRGVTYVQETHPEVLTHLSAAAHHLLAAVRSLAGEPAERHTPSAPAEPEPAADLAEGDGAAPPRPWAGRAVRIDVQPDGSGTDDTQDGTDPEPGPRWDSASSTSSEQEPWT